MIRYAFIPADYREPVVLGWRDATGFYPDSPLASREGFLIRTKASGDTPTAPPPKGVDNDE